MAIFDIMVVMYDLPLFPLNTVLFPGMPLSLHIFEDRYKMMIGLCLERRRPFGVVLIKNGVEASGPLAEPHMVGCTAQITQVERIGGGRMNIGAIGRRRFRILELAHDKPYLVGKVVNYPLAVQGTGARQASRRLLPWVVRYMDELSAIEGVEFEPQQLPDDPAALAYVAATLLRIPAKQKQQLLAAVDLLELLNDLRWFYRREIAFVKMMLAHRVTDQGLYSLN